MEFKKHGKVLIPIGWVLIALSVLALVGMLRQPRHRNPFIESFLNQPDSISISGFLGVIIGSNILNLLVLLFGVYAAVRKNQQGKFLIIASVVLFCISSGILFLPSSGSAINSQSNSITVTHPQSEFEVTFPHPIKKKVVTVAGLETVAYDTEGLEPPYLRAELINTTDIATIRNNFRAVLENYAKLAGLSLPEITETRDSLGTVGTYSGFKKVGDVTIRIYGKMVLGKSSALNCLISENLEVFPSEDTAKFLVSIKRK
ncbi:MAG: hypothetical protein WBC22_16805 [Sedimentisphaerales bacterium]